MYKTREEEILKALYFHRSMTVKEIAHAIFTSETSVRRDLARLEAQGLVKRFHGGATLGRNGVGVLKNPYSSRKLVFAEEKELIGKTAASLVKENFLIFLDASTTAYNVMPFLKDIRELTVVTNNVKILNDAEKWSDIRIISTGGILTPIHYALHGSEAMHTIGNYFAQICFFSCGGFDDCGEISSLFNEENDIRRAMIAQSNFAYLLCTSNKMGVRKAYRICSIQDTSGIICTKEPYKVGKDKAILALPPEE